MHLLVRVAGVTGAPSTFPSASAPPARHVDLRVHLADGCTVGTLADDLARVLGADRIDGTLTISCTAPGGGSRLLDRGDLVEDVGPTSGAAVELRPARPIARPGAPVSPASLVGDVEYELRYGANSLDDAVVEVSEAVEVVATGRCTPTVNGSPVVGSARLRSGDLVTVGAHELRLRVDAELRPPARSGPQIRLVRTLADPPDPVPPPVEFPPPPTASRLPGFPVLSATVPLLMGVALWVATRSIATAVFILFSFVFVVASGLEARRESRAERRFREDEFRADVAELLELVDELHTDWGRSVDRWSPDPASLIEAVSERDAIVWSRSCRLQRPGQAPTEATPDRPNCHTLLVRVGTSPLDAVSATTTPSSGRRDRREQLDRRIDAHPRATLPATIDLGLTNGVAIVGPGELPSGLARSILATLATTLTPNELTIVTVTAPHRAARWTWCDWLPHSQPRSAPAVVVVLLIDGATPAAVDEEQQRLRAGGADTFIAIWLSGSSAGAPRPVHAAAFVDPATRPGLTVAGIDADEVHFDSMSIEEAEQLARRLAPLRPAAEVHLDDSGAVAAEADHGGSDAATTLRSIADPASAIDSPAEVLTRWQDRRDGLEAPIGRIGRGVVSVDLVRDGPHALIAGTTGAGKSELLRTLITSLALQHSPRHLNFLLVDYKGGTAFGPLASLPHAVGMVTDLTAELAERALDSLHAEIRRREEALARLGAAYDMASLVIVVDEFATLARELPRFVDGVVDIAQRGRSLGVHLVLATQRPAGVVTDSIRANTDLRIALRVADDEDSRDVVGVADAAHLPRDVAGSAVLRVGPRNVARFRAAWTGAPAAAAPQVICTPLHTTAPDRSRPATQQGGGRTELDVAIETVTQAFIESGAPAPRRPWLDPLPDRLLLASVGSSSQSGRLRIGLVDRPRSQRVDTLDIDLDRDGGVVVLGAHGSGRSTTVDTIVEAAAAHVIDDVHVDVITSAPSHDDLRAMRAVGSVVDVHDSELVLRILRRAAAGGPSNRRASGQRTLLVIDGFAEFEQHYERIDRGEAIEILSTLSRDARTHGVHLVVAAGRRSELPPTLFAALGCRIHLRCPTEDDAVLNGLPTSSADPRLAPGRGRVDGDLVQIAVGPAMSPSGYAVPSRAAAMAVQRLPTHLSLGRILEDATHQRTGPDTSTGARDERGRWRLPIGVDADRLQAATLDLGQHHGLVVGPPRSGRTSALATIGESARSGGITVLTVGAGGSVAERADALEAAATGARDLATRSMPTLLLVDDVVDLIERGRPDVESSLAAVLDLADTAPVRLVATAEADAALRAFSDVIVRLRAGRTGLLLQADPDLHALVLHTSIGARGDVPTSPGRGWLCGPSDSVLVQVALAESDSRR